MTTDVNYEESEYEELRKLGQKLHIPIAEAFWELEVRDKDGNIVKQHRQRSHSWVRNAYNLFFAQGCCGQTHSSDGTHIKDINNTTREVASQCVCVRTYDEYKGASGDSDTGIVVGSGSVAEDFEHYALQSRITEGTGAGQLNFAAMANPTISTIGLTKRAQWLRYMNNNSGGDVTVNEVGLYTNRVYIGSNVYGPPGFMTCRDKLPSSIIIPNTGQLKVTYTIDLTYPA